MTRRRGFTLIELLVVIAIIAILAAMLFPVFARARESARKIQCLSNMKNIAMAFQMYLTDYDKLLPNEHGQDVLDYYSCSSDPQIRATCTNPYLREPVILDEYIRNRDVWRCPSAGSNIGYGINGNINGQGWFQRVVDAGWFCPFMGCLSPFPPGWGGTVTDSLAQATYEGTWIGAGCVGSANGGLQLNYQGFPQNRELKTAQITDPARWLAMVEAGYGEDNGGFAITSLAQVAYPGWCRLACAACEGGPSADWEGCSWTVECGAGDARLGTDPEYRKDYLKTRHLGGVNLAFTDGHAAWMSSEAVMFAGHDNRWWIPDAQKNKYPAIEGPVGICGDYSPESP